MPLDPSIYGLVESPLNQLSKIRAVAAQQQQQEQQRQLLPLQLQAAKDEATQRSLQIQQSQRALASQDALNQAYQGAITKDANGNPSIDTQKVTDYLGANGQGHQVPAVLKSIADAQSSFLDIAKKKGDIQKQTQDVAALQTDAMGSLGLAVRAAGNDPTAAVSALGLAAAHGQIDKATADGLLQKIQQNPTPQFVASLIDPLIAASPKAQESLKNAGQARSANETADTTAAMRPGALTNQGLTTTELTQKTNGTTPITPEQKAQLRISQQSANAATSNAATNRSRFSLEQFNAGLDANGKPIQYSDASGNMQNVSDLAKAIATYRLPPVNARGYTSGAGRGLMQQVLAVNPQFDIGDYENRYKTMQDLRPGGKIGQQALALNTLVRHSDDLIDAANALKNGTFVPGNALYNRIATAFGSAPPTNFNQFKQYVVGETVKLVRGSGGSEEDVKNASKPLSDAASPEQLAGAMDANFAVAGGKAQAINEAVRKSIGKPEFNIIDQGATDILKKRGYDPNTLKRTDATGTVRVKSASGQVGTFRGTADDAKKAGYAVIQ